MINKPSEASPAQGGRGRGRPRNFNRTEKLAQAMAVFWERGYEGASIADLTTAMEITAQSLYAAYGSKAALYREALAYYQGTLGNYVAEILAAPIDTMTAMEQVLRQAVVEFTQADRPRGCMVSLGALACADEHRAEAEYVGRLRENAVAVLVLRLQKGVAAGDVRADADPHALARYVGAMIQGLSIQARDGAERQALEPLVDIACQALQAWRAIGANRG